MSDKQSQKAGDNAQQIQAQRVYITNGISEERVREICSEEAVRAIADNTLEANETAMKRIERFVDLLLPRIQRIENDYQSFSDPAFQVLLRKTQLTAACTEREDDYKILSELLVHRINNKTNIKKKASIAKAIEIIDQIDDDSLLALTVFLTMSKFVPTSGIISDGLKAISDLYGKFDLDLLPNGDLWQDNLSILGAITVSEFGSLKKFEDYFTERLPGYVCAGIKKDSEDYTKAVEMLYKCGFRMNCLVDNEILPGYSRLPIVDKNSIDNLSLTAHVDISGTTLPINVSLNDKQKEIFKMVFDMYSKDVAAISSAKAKFIELINSYPSVYKAMKWWDSIQAAITLTSVGQVIGHTNAKSIDPNLPNLD